MIFKSRTMNLLLYPDDTSHVDALDIISKSYNHAYCLHDSDILDIDKLENVNDVTFKKQHWHVVLQFPNARGSKSVAEELGITHNYIEQCHNLDASLLYLIHYNNPDKAQYDFNNVHGTLKSRLEKLLCGEQDEGIEVLRLLELLHELPEDIRYTDFLRKACEAGLWSQFRKLGYGIKMLLDDHKYFSDSYN